MAIARPKHGHRMVQGPLSSATHADVAMFQPQAMGFALVDGNRQIHWDNRVRGGEYCLLQISLGGAGRFCHQGRWQSVPVGRGFLIQIPSDTAYGLPLGDHWEWIYIAYAGDWATTVTRRIIQDVGMFLDLRRCPAIRHLCRWYDAEVDRSLSAYAHSQRLYALLMILQEWAAQQVPSTPALPQAVRRALAVIDARAVDPDFGMATLAAAVDMSRFHLARLFRVWWDRSPSQQIRKVRMERAMHLLTWTALSGAEVASQSGFGSTTHFCVAFRQRFGCSPGSLRRRAGGAGEESNGPA